MISPSSVLQPKASIIAVFLIVVSLFFTTMYGYSVYQQTQKKAIEDTSLFAKSTINELQQYLEKYASDVKMLSNSPLISDIVEGEANFSESPNDGVNHQRLAQIFKAYMGSNTQVVQTRLIGLANNGLEVVRVNRLNNSLISVESDLLQPKAHRDYFQAMLKLKPGQVYVSDVSLNRDFGTITTPFMPVVRIGLPIFTKSGELFGLLLINVDVSDRLAQIAQPIKAGGNLTHVLLLNAQGSYLTHPEKSKRFGFEFDQDHNFANDFLKLSDSQLINKAGEFNGFEAKRYFYSEDSLPLDTQDRFLKVVTVMAVRPIIVNTIMSALYLGLLLIVIISAFMVYLIYSSRNLKLETKQTALKAELEFELIFKDMIETAPYAKVLVNEQGTIELVNIETEKMFGYRRSELLGQSIEMLVPQKYSSHHENLRKQYNAKPTNRQMSPNTSLTALKKDGSELPVEINLTPIESYQGKKIQATIADVSERQKFIAELSRQNYELNQFAYVASHDLKAPLRGIDQIASWLEEDLMDSVGADSKKHLKLMRSRINRMEKLLADLLQYARAGSVLGDLESVDLHDLVTSSFQLINTSQRFKLVVNDQLPTLTTSRTLIDIVFRNLMSNAMKHHDRPKGVITLKCTKKGAFYQFEMCDDGPGIPEEFRERVFGLFQTLKPRDEVEGSGMGLSIVKKTIETIGGKISIGDCEPSGAKITFTWPIELQQEPEPPAA